MLNNRWRAWLPSLLMMVSCGSKAASTADNPEPKSAQVEQPDDHAHQQLPTRVQLSKAVLTAAQIETALVGREKLVSTIALPGELVADPDRSAHVASPIAGRVERVSFREGSSVKKGDVLATIRVPDLGKLRSSLAATLAKASAARANTVRQKALLDQRLTSEQSYLDAVATAEALDVEARATQEHLAALGLGAGATQSNASILSLRAPVSGVVVARNAVVGQPVGADEVLADIVDLSELWFLGRVFERDLGRLQIGANAEVQLNAYPKERFSGTIEYIGRQVDPIARTVTARIRLANCGEQLRVGLFGNAHVSTREGEDELATIVVPRNALTEIAGKSAVFVQRDESTFEMHVLTLGNSAAGKVQVLAGLHEGEQVVVSGVFSLKSAVLKSSFTEDE